MKRLCLSVLLASTTLCGGIFPCALADDCSTTTSRTTDRVGQTLRKKIQDDFRKQGLEPSGYEAALDAVIDGKTPADRQKAVNLLYAGADISKRGDEFFQRARTNRAGEIMQAMYLVGYKPPAAEFLEKSTAVDADEPEDEEETDEPKESNIIRCINNMKRVSGKVNMDADVFVLVIITDEHVENLCGGREDIKQATRAFKEGGVAKCMRKIQNKKNVQTILAVRKGTNLTYVKKYMVKWIGLKCPIMIYDPMEEYFNRVAGDSDCVLGYSRNGEHIVEGSIDMVAHNMDSFLKELDKWMADQTN